MIDHLVVDQRLSFLMTTNYKHRSALMFAMSIRELLTYLSSLPPETKFPIGFSGPFIINNVVDQIIFRPR